MKKISRLEPVFTTAIPEKLEPGKIYVSIEYATISHLCCCGCAREVVTPLTPIDWKLTYDGETISMHPSIGNWSFPCRSHYWIRNGRIKWADDWTPEQVQAGRARDRRAKERQFGETPNAAPNPNQGTHSTSGFWDWLKRLWKK
ncbi:DUF6527 family protein [Thalassobaculum sp. OXR-137]|uniref:DUF6527 family protein n=1 Tax=Thalassobaculum sp. OXR-137 TaxID=3100173 RepID=UPI002AC8C781|nr:DUF6527 family protein [Thalassobaculum sp. OXR-137]WPZ35830.1 DUF6527 family protein [Thalassobaculum sp. OXR-137]